MQLSRSSYLKDWDISESAERIFSLLKENVSELKLETIDFQTDVTVNIKVNENFWNLCCLHSVLF
jgi:hypothetical protein